MDMTMRVEGLERLLASSAPEHLLGPPVTNAMNRSVIGISNVAKRYAPVDRGTLRARITYQVDSAPIPKFGKVGVLGGGGTVEVYGKTMEEGRRAGARMPPVSAIAAWLRRKGSDAPAFVVARNIARRGIQPKRFLGRALAEARAEVESHFARAAREIEERWRG